MKFFYRKKELSKYNKKASKGQPLDAFNIMFSYKK